MATMNMKLSDQELETIYYALLEREDKLRAVGDSREELDRILGRISDALAVVHLPTSAAS